MNALFEAAKRGDVKALKKALNDPNIDPNAQDERTGITALHTAAAWNNTSCVREMLVDKRTNHAMLDYANRRAIDLFDSKSKSPIVLQHKNNEHENYIKV